MSQIIAIMGPTAVGKTDIAFELAKKINGQIVSCDSMLVYQEPRIITAKPSLEMLAEIKHHFISTISVTQTYNVFDYMQAATKVIEQLINQNTPVIICGGTGLYLKALLDGIAADESKDDQLRAQLADKAFHEGNISLHNDLKKIDPVTAEKLAVNDVNRVIRALEVFYKTGTPVSQKKRTSSGLWGKYQISVFGLGMDREELYARINSRVDQMIVQGAVDEVRELIQMPLSITAKKIIGIPEIADYLSGFSTLEQAKELMKQNTRNYAKRQMTWFRKEKRVQWIDVDKKNIFEIVKQVSL